MSKMDALRAMREERYEQAQKAGQRAGQPGFKATRAGEPARRTTPATRPPVAPPVGSGGTEDSAGTAPAEALCGHKNMSGRSCTRPHGHSEKSHRYS